MAKLLASVPLIGVVAVAALASSAHAADEKHPVALTDGADHVAVNAEQTSQPPAPPSTAQPRVLPAQRGRWGIAVGIRRFGGTATWDFRNSATPQAGTSGPYTGAVLEIDHDWVAPYVSFGYRGPVSRGSRLGVGIEGGFAAALNSPPDVQAIGTSPTGIPVTFSSSGGIVGFGNWAVSGHASYAVAPSFKVSGGAAVSTLLVKAGAGGYLGIVPSTSNSFFCLFCFFGPPGPTPKFYVTAIVPRVGAEYVFWNHGSLDVAADFEPGGTKRLADTPVVQTFRRRRVSLTAAMRFIF